MVSVLWLYAFQPRHPRYQVPSPVPPDFFWGVCVRLLSSGGKPIHKLLMDQYIRPINQIFSSLEEDDFRHNMMGKIDSHLRQHISSYMKADSPPNRVLPLPVHTIHALDITLCPGTPRQKSIWDITWIVLFFLQRPGKYCKCGADTDQHPLWLRYIQFSVGNCSYNDVTAPQEYFAHLNFIRLIFTTKKMAPRENTPGTSAPATPPGVQWWQCIATWNILGTMAPPEIPPLQVSSTPGHGHKYVVLISPPPSKQSPGIQAQILGSRTSTSAPSTSAQEGPWFSSWTRRIGTQYAKWGGDGPEKLSHNSTQPWRASQWDCQSACSNTAITRSSRLCIPGSSAKQTKLACRIPQPGGSGGLAQDQYCLVNLNIPFLAHSSASSLIVAYY